MPRVVRRAEARRGLIERFVAIIDDDRSLTLETNVQEAILHLPDEEQGEARILLQQAEIDGERFRLRELFTKDPNTY
ncbi:MAG: hypothetical protein ACRDHU_01790 [Actinomycetota bacterium]